MSIPSKISLYGENSSTCGYCGSKSRTSWSFSFESEALSCEEYQKLADCGWRRCGNLFYLPLNHKTCCPAITIKTDASKFTLSKKSHRKSLKRLAKKVEIPNAPLDSLTSFFDELAKQPQKLRVEVQRSCYSQPVFELYKKYQSTVHGDNADEITREQFEAFLVHSPLEAEKTMHFKYFLQDKLIAVGVVDLLPNCLSSVYFF